MKVGMCDCDRVCLFFVSGLVLGCSLSWISVGPPSNVGPIPSPPHYLPVVGVSPRWCTCGSRYLGWVLWCELAQSRWLLARAWTLGLCRGSPWRVISPRVSGLWVHGRICLGVDGCRACGLITPAPWGFCTVAARWFPWDSPLLFSGGVVVVLAVVLLGFLHSGGPLDVCGLMSVAPYLFRVQLK
ncbi:hypothetical protein AMECASPLE_013970 [Ameca splendens]|uniref:Uncharacterized protein n=1 Tax=Ameca splendens TaxID=208324 RepID=A0ABV0ZAU5_9TELE